MEVKAGSSFTPYYYHADGLGSITGLSDATGTMVQTYGYDAFGNVTVSGSGNVAQPFMFTGREYDAETQMYFYCAPCIGGRARYYDPQAGRFVTRDPIGFAGGINKYAYVSNDPVNGNDPLGLFDKGGPGSAYKGHRDFSGSNIFDYYLEDTDPVTGPTIFGNPERHFRDLSLSEAHVSAAIANCSSNDFQRAMHRGQDYFVHFAKGYRWMPFRYWKNLGFGHFFDGFSTDNDDAAWRRAEEWTKIWLNRWHEKCSCPGR